MQDEGKLEGTWRQKRHGSYSELGRKWLSDVSMTYTFTSD